MEPNRRHTWIIADTHFNHDKMCEYEYRPLDFSRRIVRHWRAMIAPNDLVYHLGDFYLGKRSEFINYMGILPGVKILIKGNHDREKPDWYLNRGFAAVMDFAAVISRTNMRKNGEHFLYTRVLLSHRPMKIPEITGGKWRKTINIHGHFHKHSPEHCGKTEPDLMKVLTPDHYLFSLESTKYKPVLLNQAVKDGWVLPFRGMKKPWLK
jgi:calcineurin-like phosphoesterase family protein